MTKVCVIICATGRPDLLRRCLRSLGAQRLHADMEPEIVVVDPLGPRTNWAVIEEFQGTHFHPLRYVQARAVFNAAKLAAFEARAAWMVHIDDNQVADEGWLARLHAEYATAPQLRHAS
jgi:hypothetical protein